MAGIFDGKVAIVTGAGSGIGQACAIAYAREGARVVVSDIQEDSGQQTVRMISDSGGESFFFKADVSISKEVREMIKAAVEKYDRLDLACNNAGIGGPSAPTGEYPEDGWNKVIAINLTGVWLCMRYEIPEMLRTGGGAIINMASILGRVGFVGSPAYVAAKHGVLGLTKAAAIEYATRNIRINAVCPGFIYTPLLEKAGMARGTELYSTISNMHPVKRMGTSEEVASAVIWLSSPQASFVTGESLLVDGGYTAQ